MESIVDISATSSINFAVRACSHCKRGKRKCDKKLPQCTSCRKANRECFYSKKSTQSMKADSNQILDLAHRQTQDISPISVYFLDLQVFCNAELQIPIAEIPIPSYVTSIVGNMVAVQQTATDFFGTIHCWMPIISKKRFYDHRMNPLVPRQSDTTLLCLCMKLLTWRPSANDSSPNTSLYFAAKQYAMELDTAGIFALQPLQAKLLIAIYELSHAIYPSACLTISSCARYGRALGINWRPTVHARKPQSWIEMEEERRVWWAIVILECFVNLGCPDRSLEIEDPGLEDLLPVDDSAWDHGLIVPSPQITLSSTANPNLGRFARLAHSTHLLSKVLRHLSDPSVNSNFYVEEERQLDRTIQALLRISNSEVKSRESGYTFICYSALIALFKVTAALEPRTPEEVDRREYAKQTIDAASNRIAIISHHFLDSQILPVEEINPLILHWVYTAAVAYIRANREEPSKRSEEALGVLKEALKKINGRWKIAGTYLHILEGREAMSSA